MIVTDHGTYSLPWDIPRVGYFFMHELLEFLKNNQFASGGLLLGAFAFFYRYGMKILDILINYFKRSYLVTYTISSEEAPTAFLHVSKWLTDVLRNNKKNIYDRTITIQSSFSRESLHTNISSGKYFIKTDFGYAFVSFDTKEMKAESNYGGGKYKNYDILITVLKKNSDKIDAFISSISSAVPYQEMYCIKTSHYDIVGHFDYSHVTEKSLILDGNLFKDVVDDLKTFYSSKEKYSNLGIPYKRIIILHGPPGNGKTSLIKYLNTFFKKNICNCKIQSITIDTICDVQSATKENCIFVFEDLDREDLDKEQDGASTLGTLLNLFDGLATPSNFVGIITCNDINKLDPAFIRPGRVDRIFEVKNATKDQVTRIFLKFFPGHNHSAQMILDHYVDYSLSAAKVQEICMINNSLDAYQILIKPQ